MLFNKCQNFTEWENVKRCLKNMQRINTCFIYDVNRFRFRNQMTLNHGLHFELNVT
jgi:hypothetical protein